jgi:signal transduction histidine kinase
MGSGVISTLSLAITAAAALPLGALVLAQRRGHPVGRLLVAAGVGFGIAATSAGILATGTTTSLGSIAFAALWLVQGPLIAVWVLLLLGLPEGDIGGGWRRAVAGVAVVFPPVLSVVGWLVAPEGRSPAFPAADVPAGIGGPAAAAELPTWVTVGTVAAALLPVLALVGLIIRYAGSQGPSRQQLKWVVLAAGLTVVVNAVSPLLGAVGTALTLAAQVVPPLGIALAVLRYRLWEVDVVIARSALFVVLWAGLAALFHGLALAAGVVAGGDNAVLLPLTLALVVAALARPLRDRIERMLRDRLFGTAPEGYAVVVGFADRLAGAVDGEELAGRVAAEIRRCLEVEVAAVWLLLDGGGGSRLLRMAQEPEDAGTAHSSVVVGPGLADDLAAARAGLVNEAPASLRPVLETLGRVAAFAPLRVGGELIGVLTIGEPPRRRLSPSDLELLDVLASESVLALRNTRLEAALRQRLLQLEEQAEELRRSRRRIVAVQDEQRRRTERDLHDGVQPMLVSLATQLRRASSGSDRSPDLGELADLAEEAVFAVQDFGRGIYPTVLADQGLPAALRAHANRVPAAIHVEIAPRMGRRRFPAEVETTCYFVALEAITNSLKHAPGATIGVTVRLLDDAALEVEVRDDGPGFRPDSPGAGSGLQNMRDRAAAAGGSLVIDARPGEGTWVRLTMPLPATVIQDRFGDSRR